MIAISASGWNKIFIVPLKNLKEDLKEDTETIHTANGVDELISFKDKIYYISNSKLFSLEKEVQ